MSVPRSLEAEWLCRYPRLALLDPVIRAELLRDARSLQLPAGTVAFRDGDRCGNYLLLLEGTMRIQKVSESGREIVLYRVGAGESCILTTTCLLSSERYPAGGVAETPIEALAIPVASFQDALGRSAAFRDLVFTQYGRRIADLILLVEDVAFARMDSRLAQCLIQHAKLDNPVQATHRELAAELGTAREVVSRLLKEFERRGWVRLGRGAITVSDSEAMSEQAGPALV